MFIVIIPIFLEFNNIDTIINDFQYLCDSHYHLDKNLM